MSCVLVWLFSLLFCSRSLACSTFFLQLLTSSLSSFCSLFYFFLISPSSTLQFPTSCYCFQLRPSFECSSSRMRWDRAWPFSLLSSPPSMPQLLLPRIDNLSQLHEFHEWFHLGYSFRFYSLRSFRFPLPTTHYGTILRYCCVFCLMASQRVLHNSPLRCWTL